MLLALFFTFPKENMVHPFAGGAAVLRKYHSRLIFRFLNKCPEQNSPCDYQGKLSLERTWSCCGKRHNHVAQGAYHDGQNRRCRIGPCRSTASGSLPRILVAPRNAAVRRGGLETISPLWLASANQSAPQIFDRATDQHVVRGFYTRPCPPLSRSLLCLGGRAGALSTRLRFIFRHVQAC